MTVLGRAGHRGHISKEGDTLVRWAAVEAIQRQTEPAVKAVRDGIVARRGKTARNIAKVAGFNHPRRTAVGWQRRRRAPNSPGDGETVSVRHRLGSFGRSRSGQSRRETAPNAANRAELLGLHPGAGGRRSGQVEEAAR
jgi:hypothetical protein